MKYAKLALENQADNPDLANMFLQMSGEELHHMQMISGKMTGMVEKLHEQYKGV